MLRTKYLALAAGLTLAASAGTALAMTAGTASAATPSCGSSCVNIYPREYSGQSLDAPQFVLDVLRQGDRVGQPVILFRTSNSDPAEDFSYSDQGEASDFYAAGQISSEVALHYGCTGSVPVLGAQIPCGTNSEDDEAYEIQYSPYGVDSGLCVGEAGNGKVALEACGISSRTVWIEDTVNSPVSPYYAGINGSDTNFSDPSVLTYNADAYPTDKPRSQLYVTSLGGFQGGTTDNDNQLWTGFEGVLP